MQEIDRYLSDHREQFEKELCEFLRIPSVSTDGQHQADVAAAANWVAEQLQTAGCEVDVIKTTRHPIVFGETKRVADAPTVLVYGHYDVQPADPLNEWISPPFEPVIRDGNVYARGATDDKGQMLTHIKSAQAWMNTAGKLPINLKFLIEGEEEVGSDSLYEFLDGKYDTGKSAQERLQSDVAVISDSCQFGPGQPAITYGLKGIAYFELRLTGPKQDLHSGSFGGGVTNPANTLAKMLAALSNDEGQVQIPGFYDDVIPISDREREQLASLPFDEADFMKQIGVNGTTGEAGYTNLERRWARPTYDVNGLTSGYQGEGAKTVLPAKASAKFSFRLVPNQDPAKIKLALRKMLAGLCPPGIRMQIIDMHSAPGVVVPLESPYMTAAAKAIELGFGKAPVFIREGGSIPVVTAFAERLGIDTLLLGWGLNDDNTHSPNEKFCLADFHRGIKASAHLWDELSKLNLGG